MTMYPSVSKLVEGDMSKFCYTAGVICLLLMLVSLPLFWTKGLDEFSQVVPLSYVSAALDISRNR